MLQKNATLGIALMVLSVMLFSFKDSIVKMTAVGYSPILIVWAQMTFTGLILLAVTLIRNGWSAMLPRPFALQVLRAFFVLAGMGTFYWAIQLIPLAEATAMQFIAPLITTALSPAVLGEHVGPRRWASVVAGLIGVLIILRPEFGGDRFGYFVGLSAGVLIGFYFLLQRKLAGASSPFAALAYSATLGAIMIVPFLPGAWQVPIAADIKFVVGFLIFALAGQICIFSSFHFGEASLVSPFVYTQIVGATIFGYIFFGEFPDLVSWLGIAIIVGSGLYVAMRETRRRAPR